MTRYCERGKYLVPLAGYHLVSLGMQSLELLSALALGMLGRSIPYLPCSLQAPLAGLSTARATTVVVLCPDTTAEPTSLVLTRSSRSDLIDINPPYRTFTIPPGATFLQLSSAFPLTCRPTALSTRTRLHARHMTSPTAPPPRR